MNEHFTPGRGRPRRADVYRQLDFQIVYKRDRARYLRALRRADAGEPSPLGEMAILNSLHRFVIPAVAGPARLVPLAALETPAIKAPALRAAAERGRLRATRGPDGQWRSSRRGVDEYMASRYRRDDPPAR